MMFVYGTGISFEELNPRNSYRVSLAREKGERKTQSPKVDGCAFLKWLSRLEGKRVKKTRQF